METPGGAIDWIIVGIETCGECGVSELPVFIFSLLLLVVVLELVVSLSSVSQALLEATVYPAEEVYGNTHSTSDTP